jgi:hypothetical protein
MDGVNSTRIYCKNFCKCHSVHPVQQSYDNKGKGKNKTTPENWCLEYLTSCTKNVL